MLLNLEFFPSFKKCKVLLSNSLEYLLKENAYPLSHVIAGDTCKAF